MVELLQQTNILLHSRSKDDTMVELLQQTNILLQRLLTRLDERLDGGSGHSSNEARQAEHSLAAAWRRCDSGVSCSSSRGGE